MFIDHRSKRIVLVAHCILNQNAISDGTAHFPGSFRDVVDTLVPSIHYVRVVILAVIGFLRSQRPAL
jgi:hypothetical protein